MSKVNFGETLFEVSPVAILSVQDMLDLNRRLFLDTMLKVRRTKTVIEGFANGVRMESITDETRSVMTSQFSEMRAAASTVGANLTIISIDRVLDNLNSSSATLTVQNIYDVILDVESRFLDESSSIGFLVLSPLQKLLMSTDADGISQWAMSDYFPDAAREYEEAAKCHALMRDTATVFHAMRMLEIGIRKMASLLSIDDPIKPAERNWGNILRHIRKAIDDKFEPNSRLTGDYIKYDQLYASLDAVRGPWRNATMHVESFYTQSDAQHILNCVAKFMEYLSELCEPIDQLMLEKSF